MHAAADHLAKTNQIEPFAQVQDLLTRLPGTPHGDLAKLLPDEWVKSHPEAERRWSR